MKTASLDLHDASILNTKLTQLKQLREFYPNFKVSLFFIPFDYNLEKSPQRIYRDRNLKELKENLDWIQLIPHGLAHLPYEFEKCDRHTMKMAIASVDTVFKEYGLPYEKGFCAPYWLWNQDVVDILDENGWWGAVDRNQPGMLRTKRFYQYSHSIDEPFWKSTNEVLKLHGHTDLPSSNNLDDCLPNLIKLPADTQWKYVTDFIEV
jgi:predicted deacetylase